ncbi:MAG: M23 family metallopeptidase [Oscillospiraceae bacterium]
MQKKSSTCSAKTRTGGKRTTLGAKEKRRLIQLILCVGLFLVVFLGKGIAPDGVFQSGEALLQLIRSDTDFKGAFSALGEAFSKGEPVTQTLGNLAKEVFGAGTQEEEESQIAAGPVSEAARQALAQLPTQESMLLQLGVNPQTEQPVGDEQAEPEPQTDKAASAPEIPAYTGPALPAGATMDYVDLGLTNSVTPVQGEVTSPYGYRDHPVNGEYLFHSGIDLAADIGTPVAAFADGTVDFIGESEAYGLYIQLDHGNGVKTFYCHCSALYAQKGEVVSAGQTIAAVGDTGNATGPHLHLEIKRDGVLLNPIYYIETD